MFSEISIPTRSAPPRPPESYGTREKDAWSNDDFFALATTTQPIRKKKPPPRPPPPRFRKDCGGKLEDRGKKPARPTELLTNFFGRKPQRRNDTASVAYGGNRGQITSARSSNPTDASVSLIDLSPPGSPTFPPTRATSSSDGVSVDSFGSDGNSNPSVFTSSSGNTSQTESAFEDDFDFFGSLSSYKNGTMGNDDPWKTNNANQDPFSPFASSGGNSSSSAIGTRRIGDARFFAHNEASTTTTTMPTIIRARPPKPPAPKTLYQSLAPTVVTDFSASASQRGGSTRYIGADNAFDSSPPMPSIPPPAPPPSEYLAKFDDIAASAKETAPPRPHGIALYDFEASQSGDLSLKRGERVELVRAVNDEWLEGRVGDNRHGIFPANFVDVIVPLSNDVSRDVIVNALYAFTGETWEDLSFQEGDKIVILSRISDDWLYGECGGKRGQFPANYVERVSRELPKYS